MRQRNQQCTQRVRRKKIGAAFTILVGLIFLTHGCGRTEPVVPETQRYEKLTNADTIETVMRFCGECHPVPSPASFPRSKWPAEVERGYKFYYESGRTDLKEPEVGDTIRYFQSDAPDRLAVLSAEEFPVAESGIQFVRSPLVTADEPITLTSHVLWEEQTKSLLLSDMATGKLRRWNHLSVPGILAMKDTESIVLDSSSVISNGKNLCRINVCDWNKDGFNDYLIGEIGSTIVSDFKLGCVSLLIGKPDGSVDRHVIAEDLARTVEAVPFDYDDDGDLDVLVAEFGWNRSGGFRLLRNQSQPNTPVNELRFTEEVLDPRHGILAIQIADMDGDSRLDIVTAYGQEYETVEILFNRAPGEYEKKVIARMPDPSYNSSAIVVSDLDQDGHLDVVHTCGDIFDSFIPKPFHGLRWIRNLGNGEWERRELGMLIGAMQPTVADFDGDGDLDLAVAGFFPNSDTTSVKCTYDSVCWWEQKENLEFVRHSIERDHCLHATCTAADVDGDGRVDLVVGELADKNAKGALRIFWNRPRR
jgi:hypothetical protein